MSEDEIKLNLTEFQDKMRGCAILAETMGYWKAAFVFTKLAGLVRDKK